MGADVNAQNSEGKTPLHEAILRGHKSIVEYMLKNGANVHLKTRCGEPPLLMAVHQDDPAMIDLLLKCGAHLSNVETKTVAEMVSLAARSGAVLKLQLLKMAGADLAVEDELKQTPLHKAVLSNNPSVVEYLIEMGGDTNARDVLNFSPLDYARQLHYRNIERLLEK